MGSFIVRQPDGFYALFSTIIDNFAFFNLTEDEVREIYVARAIEQAKRDAEEAMRVADGTGPRVRFHTFETCVETVRFRHGDKEVEKLLKAMNE